MQPLHTHHAFKVEMSLAARINMLDIGRLHVADGARLLYETPRIQS